MEHQKGFLFSLIRDLTDVLYEEHGTGVQYRTTLTGIDYFENKYGATLKKETLEATIEATLDAMKTEGLIESASWSVEGIVLNIEFRGYILQEMDRELLSWHGKIVNCPCGNIIMHFVDSLLGKYSELVKVDLDGEKRHVMICMMGAAV